MKDIYRCTYKKRTPNPGVCRVISINFEERRLEVTNGAVRIYPNFEDVNLQRVEYVNNKLRWIDVEY